MSISIKRLIENALMPCGETLYVWGGGWNKEDTGSGETALMNGLYRGWKEFFLENKTGYDYKPGKEAWKAGDRSGRFHGLDCSGFLGWVIYNTVEKNKDPNGYVTHSKDFADSLAGKGLGKVAEIVSVRDFSPGDIVSLSSHVYLVADVLSDGSILIIHSTRNGGVQLSGLCDSCDNAATEYAKSYMKSNHPKWWESFKDEGTFKKSVADYTSGKRFRFSVL